MNAQRWNSRLGFIMAAIASAIGLGNIWRFPYITFENGGGAFLIPYLLAMFTAGIPLMIYEFYLGNKYRYGAPKTFKTINNKFEWLGWFQVIIGVVISVYYMVIIGWSISYFYFSFSGIWGNDTEQFFMQDFLQLSDSVDNLGSIQWHIALAVFIGWAATYLIIIRGVKKGIEKAVKILMPLLFFMVLILIASVINLPGAISGINYLFEPDFSKLLDINIWVSAYSQMFFTLSIGFSIMIVYSSYMPKESDVSSNAFITVFINCGFSLLAGILVFSIIGYMAHAESLSMKDAVSSGPGLAFITIPKAINLLPFAHILGPIFFLVLTFAGLTSIISIVESVICALQSKFNFRRSSIVNIFCLCGFVLSLIFTLNGGLYLIDIVDYLMCNIGLYFSCLMEVIIGLLFIKYYNIRNYINSHSDIRVNTFFEYCIKFVVPVILFILLIGTIYKLYNSGYENYSSSNLFYYGWIILLINIFISVLLNIVTSKRNKL